MDEDETKVTPKNRSVRSSLGIAVGVRDQDEEKPSEVAEDKKVKARSLGAINKFDMADGIGEKKGEIQKKQVTQHEQEGEQGSHCFLHPLKYL